MTQPMQEESRLQQLITKLGGWAGVALVSLACWAYNGDKAKTEQDIERIRAEMSTYTQQVNRLEDTKLSKEEFKTAQEVWIRETSGMREDMRDLTKTLLRQIERQK